ncbi:hypothetical protein E4U53_003534, partial [Claviceps sorghi]
MEPNVVDGGRDVDHLTALFGPLAGISLGTGIDVPDAPSDINHQAVLTQAPLTASHFFPNMTGSFSGPPWLRNATATPKSTRATTTRASVSPAPTQKPTTATQPAPPAKTNICGIHIRQYVSDVNGTMFNAIIELTGDSNNWLGAWSFADMNNWGTKAILSKEKLGYEIEVDFREDAVGAAPLAAGQLADKAQLVNMGSLGAPSGARGRLRPVPRPGFNATSPDSTRRAGPTRGAVLPSLRPRREAPGLRRRGNVDDMYTSYDVIFRADGVEWNTMNRNIDVLPHCTVGMFDDHENLEDMDYVARYLEDTSTP